MRVDLFAIPKWNFKVPNYKTYKQTILDGVQKIKKQDDGAKQSNTGGYQSKTFHLFHHPEFSSILSFLNTDCMAEIFNDLNFNQQKFQIISWVNVNTEACFNDIHIHKGESYSPDGAIHGVSLFSGVCFIHCPEGSGKLLFKNSLINNLWYGCSKPKEKNIYTVDSIEIDPIESEIHIWPSYVHHMVYMNKHHEERISIAFDIMVKV